MIALEIIYNRVWEGCSLFFPVQQRTTRLQPAFVICSARSSYAWYSSCLVFLFNSFLCLFFGKHLRQPRLKHPCNGNSVSVSGSFPSIDLLAPSRSTSILRARNFRGWYGCFEIVSHILAIFLKISSKIFLSRSFFVCELRCLDWFSRIHDSRFSSFTTCTC